MKIGPHQLLIPQLSSEPANPVDWMVYLDDGTNTLSGEKCFRQWNPDDGEWQDIGLQTAAVGPIDGGTWS